jgi:hypothetical protein
MIMVMDGFGKIFHSFSMLDIFEEVVSVMHQAKKCAEGAGYLSRQRNNYP